MIYFPSHDPVPWEERQRPRSYSPEHCVFFRQDGHHGQLKGSDPTRAKAVTLAGCQGPGPGSMPPKDMEDPARLPLSGSFLPATQPGAGPDLTKGHGPPANHLLGGHGSRPVGRQCPEARAMRPQKHTSPGPVCLLRLPPTDGSMGIPGDPPLTLKGKGLTLGYTLKPGAGRVQRGCGKKPPGCRRGSRGKY